MFKNYLKTAIRHFLKSKVITIITILGLSVGISASLVIYQIVQYDYSFDKYEPDGDRIYRIVSEGPNLKIPGVPAPLHKVVQSEVTGIKTTAALFSYDDPYVKVSIPQTNNLPPKIFNKQKNIVFADSNYFNIFPRQWITGNAGTALKAPYQLVLNESRAKLYFPGLPVSQIIGRQVIFNDTISTVVSGIVKSPEAATDFAYKEFISLSTIPHSGLKRFFNWNQWGNTSSLSQLMIKLTPGTSPSQITKQIDNIFKKQGSSKNKAHNKTLHRLQPLSNIHFNTDFGGPASKSTLRNLILLAIFLLLLGSINFINLSTARASQRAKEIGIRKTLGSSKMQLVLQFLTETFLLTFLATVLSILLIPLLLNIFSGYIPGGLKYSGIGQFHIILFLLLLVIVVTLLSGFYPAFILTKFKPVTVIKNQASSNRGSTRSTGIRKTLIITQFIIAQVFIVCVLIVKKQVHFSLHEDMGFRKAAIINFPVPYNFFSPGQKRLTLLNRLRSIPEIQAVSLGGRPPVMGGFSTTAIKYNDGKNEIKLRPDIRNGDTAYLGLYHIKLLAGRNVLPTDSVTEVLINNILARQLGFKYPREALGKFITMNGWQLPIVGVMADFHQASLKTSIHPLLFFNGMRFGHIMHVALQPDVRSWQKTIAAIRDSWKAIYPDTYFDYTFLDKTIENFYKQDIKLSGLLAWSAGIAIFIGCLGLLGLVIFMANQRTKEIGIRKVLGASVTQIIVLLSKDFIALVAIAFVIAAPIAWIAMKKWLQNFAYHTALSWWIFLISGAAMLTVALIILFIRAGRAARANPVNSLRSE